MQDVGSLRYNELLSEMKSLTFYILYNAFECKQNTRKAILSTKLIKSYLSMFIVKTQIIPAQSRSCLPIWAKM